MDRRLFIKIGGATFGAWLSGVAFENILATAEGMAAQRWEVELLDGRGRSLGRCGLGQWTGRTLHATIRFGISDDRVEIAGYRLLMNGKQVLTAEASPRRVIVGPGDEYLLTVDVELEELPGSEREAVKA